MSDNVIQFPKDNAVSAMPVSSVMVPTGTLSVVHLPGYKEPLPTSGPWPLECGVENDDADSNKMHQMFIKTTNDADGFLNAIVVDTKFYGDETRSQISATFEAMSARIKSRERLDHVLSDEYNRSAGAIKEVIIAVNMKLVEHYDGEGRCNLAYQ